MSWFFLIGTLILVVMLWRRHTATPRDGSPEQRRGSRRIRFRWLPYADSVAVAGCDIGGMVYVGRASKPALEQVCIDPSLEVGQRGDDWEGEGMGYWPSYSTITPQARATYLKWLATGRSHIGYSVGYVFLYFYGLEYRFFCDQPEKEEQERIIEEVERLFRIYGEDRSIRSYLGMFLEMAEIVLPRKSAPQPIFLCTGHEIPLNQRLAIGRMVQAKQPVGAEWMLAWLTTHPEVSLRQAARRAFPEFKALFCMKFKEQHPNGLRIACPRRKLTLRYSAASGSFEADLTDKVGDIPDISGVKAPLQDMRRIADEAQDELNRFSRYLGRNPDGRGTMGAHALLPMRLWGEFPCAEMDDLLRWATEIIEKGGFLPVEQIIERIEDAIPEKIRKQQLTGVADALARLSIGMAPDPRFALRSPKLGEPVVLFRLPERVVKLEEVGETYKGFLISVALGSFIAHADGTVAASERRALEARIAAADVTEAERARLFANLRWMLEVAPDLTLFRRHLKEVPEDARHELGKAALAMAAVDGVIDPGEIKAIQKLYKAMGLETEGIYSDLHALTSGSEPVTVREAGEAASDFAIPPPPSDSKVVLDAERISAIMANTARVSSILKDIFGDDELEDESNEEPEDSGDRFPGLDAKHSAFLDELLTQAHWGESEFGALAGQFRLMPSGALETLNEWSFEHFDDMLIDAYQGYTINQDIKAKLEH